MSRFERYVVEGAEGIADKLNELSRENKVIDYRVIKTKEPERYAMCSKNLDEHEIIVELRENKSKDIDETLDCLLEELDKRLQRIKF